MNRISSQDRRGGPGITERNSGGLVAVLEFCQQYFLWAPPPFGISIFAVHDLFYDVALQMPEIAWSVGTQLERW